MTLHEALEKKKQSLECCQLYNYCTNHILLNLHPQLLSDSDSNGTHFWITLVLSQPTPSQSGVYQCSATDGNSASYCGVDRLPCITTVTLSNEARVEIISKCDI